MGGEGGLKGWLDERDAMESQIDGSVCESSRPATFALSESAVAALALPAHSKFVLHHSPRIFQSRLTDRNHENLLAPIITRGAA
jgi:hypothetical protein